MNLLTKRFTIIGSLILLICIFLIFYFIKLVLFSQNNLWKSSKETKTIHVHSEIKVKPTNQTCLFHTCFNVYRCGNTPNKKLSIYVYPNYNFYNTDGSKIILTQSKQFKEIVEAILDSKFLTLDPDKACMFLPQIDLLNQDRINLALMGQILHSFPWWNDGENHLIFNMLPGSSPNFLTNFEVNRGNSILAGAGFDITSYRMNFDVSLPLFNPLTEDHIYVHKNLKRDWLLVSSQVGLHLEYLKELERVSERSRGFLFLGKCNGQFNYTKRCGSKGVYDYPDVLSTAEFCIVLRTGRFSQAVLLEAMKYGCIPVVVMDGYVLPFKDVIDWKRASIRIEESRLHEVVEILERIGPERLLDMQRQVIFLWQNYFSSMKKITITTLEIINDRVFPYLAKSYEDWNEIEMPIQDQFFLPATSTVNNGFTAVILTYNRLKSLYELIEKLSKVPSLSRIVVIWNNQVDNPPPASTWPKIEKSLRILHTPRNSLNNRFYPYNEIETEAILSLDDDILMLTVDELEFGYQVWREYSDRLVGFPTRLHAWNNVTNSWKYESEWSSDISMVLTGAAFFHKYYSFAYTKNLPLIVKEWIDNNMNCEDIAMNFIIANLTGKGPIKVGPRKKFKCLTAECNNSEMLSDNISHMIGRSECIRKFVQFFGNLPLKTLQFRAVPVLYGDESVFHKKYSNIGSL